MSRHDILVVDHDPFAVEVITQSLNRNGYHITATDSGESALQMLDSSHFDLVLSELVIGPSFDGLKVLHKVKDVNPCNGIIIMTDQPNRITTGDLMELDVDAFLFKPVDPEKILTCVDHCIRQSELKYTGNDRRIAERRQPNGETPICNIPDRRVFDRRQVYF